MGTRRSAVFRLGPVGLVEPLPSRGGWDDGQRLSSGVGVRPTAVEFRDGDLCLPVRRPGGLHVYRGRNRPARSARPCGAGRLTPLDLPSGGACERTTAVAGLHGPPAVAARRCSTPCDPHSDDNTHVFPWVNVVIDRNRPVFVKRIPQEIEHSLSRWQITVVAKLEANRLIRLSIKMHNNLGI